MCSEGGAWASRRKQGPCLYGRGRSSRVGLVRSVGMAQTQAGETEEVGLWTRWEGTGQGCGKGEDRLWGGTGRERGAQHPSVWPGDGVVMGPLLNWELRGKSRFPGDAELSAGVVGIRSCGTARRQLNASFVCPFIHSFVTYFLPSQSWGPVQG